MNGTLSSNSTSHAQFGGTINIASIVLGFVIVVLNARAVVTIGRTRALKTTSNIYVASLAVTDVMVGSMLFVMKLVEHLGYCEWLDDNKLASVGAFCLTLTAYMASTLTTVAIAVDRYAYISWPNFYKSNVTPRRVVLSMLPVWTVSFGLAVLMTALKSAGQGQGQGCPRSVPGKESVYVVSPVYVISCVISGTMYARISRVALRHRKAIAAATPAAPISTREEQGPSAPSSQQQFAQRIRGMKMFLVVFGAFFVCYTPYMVVHALHRLVIPVHSTVYNICLFLLAFNSFLNVPIFLSLNAEFREAFGPACFRSHRLNQTRARDGDVTDAA